MATYAKYMTAGDIVKEVLALMGLPVPTQVSSNTNDATARQMWALLRNTGRRLVKPHGTHRWVVLNRTWALATVPAQVKYELPKDFDGFIDLTGWNMTSRLPMLGPATDSQWQALKARNLGGSTISVIYRLAGGDDGFGVGRHFELYVSPSEVQQLSIEYTSRAWVYREAAVPADGPYADSPSGDGDTVLYDPELIVTALQLAFMTAKGFDTTAVAMQYAQLLEQAINNDTDAPMLSVSSMDYPLINTALNVPDTGYGL